MNKNERHRQKDDCKTPHNTNEANEINVGDESSEDNEYLVEKEVNEDLNADEYKNLRTKEVKDFRSYLVQRNLTIGQWADNHGYCRREVYKVLSGERRGQFGRSNQILIKMGLTPPANREQSLSLKKGK